VSVDTQSALVAKLSIRVLPLAIAASIAARCDIDLSPGSTISPRIDLAVLIFIVSILDEMWRICLDSN
jgi:hypothetical protein